MKNFKLFLQPVHTKRTGRISFLEVLKKKTRVFNPWNLIGGLVMSYVVGAGLLSGSTKIMGITGTISDVHIEADVPKKIEPLNSSISQNDIDLKRMAEWSLCYLIETPRKHLNYDPVFQCFTFKCPPAPEGTDPIVPCDTDARMDWEWYYMRDVTGSTEGKDVEQAFHKRMLGYVDDEGKVWSHPGCFNEGDINAVYDKKDYVYHIWGATKILKSLSEDYIRTKNPESKRIARKIMLALKRTATFDDKGRCWIKCGMGGLRADGSIVPNGWNAQPAPIVEPLVTYWIATKDEEGLEFAKSYAAGIMDNLQPNGIRFQPDGSFNGHSHGTMHALWGIAHLGIVLNEKKYIDFVKKSWDWMLTRGTGTGWFPAGPDSESEVCCVSDMISNASFIAQAGYPEYYDYIERYVRSYLNLIQFIVTPEFKRKYVEININNSEVEKGLNDVKKFQGGFYNAGLDDFENNLLGGRGYVFKLAGCCCPEGIRAVYTTWINTINRLPETALGPEGVYVNMSFSRDSQWATIVSFLPDNGRLTVKAKVGDKFFIRPPHWAENVHAYINSKPVPVIISKGYIMFDAKPGDEMTIVYPIIGFTHNVEGLWKNSAPGLKMMFKWKGNMVMSGEPVSEKDIERVKNMPKTKLFTGKPQIIPPVEFNKNIP
jgi:hypothetical protein